jgi:hypothetical protein
VVPCEGSQFCQLNNIAVRISWINVFL